MEHLQAGSQGDGITDTLLSPRLFYHSWGTERKWIFTPRDAAAQPRVLFPFLTGLFFHLGIYFEIV